MKKSKFISLVLVSAALASCSSEKKPHKKVYMRSDETAPYTVINDEEFSSEEEEDEGGHRRSHGMMYFYAFRPYGMYSPYNGGYSKAGYYSSGVKESSNLGGNTAKTSIVRGGFGSSGFAVGS